jgi:hypothetical protein
MRWTFDAGLAFFSRLSLVSPYVTFTSKGDLDGGFQNSRALVYFTARAVHLLLSMRPAAIHYTASQVWQGSSRKED